MYYILKGEIVVFYQKAINQKAINQNFKAKYIFAMNFKKQIYLRLDQYIFYGAPIRIAGLIYNTFH